MNIISKMNNVRLVAGLGIMAAVALLAGCNKRDEIREQVVPNDSENMHAAHSTPNLPQGHPPIGSGMGEMQPVLPKLNWKLPAGWTEKTAGGIRAASFSIAGDDGQSAEVGVIPLPAGGNELDLVNMWRQQMQLPVVEQAEADEQAESVAIGDSSGKLFEMASTEPLVDGKWPARILVAMTQRGSLSWFFKMTGADTLVEEQKPAFVEFLKSVSFETAPAAEMESIASETPTESAGSSAGGLPQWQLPADWKAQTPGQMVLASFSAGKAIVSISAFPGDVGGLLANVNRWRAQVNLGPLAAADLDQNLTSLKGDAKLIDVTGTDLSTGESKRLIGAIVPHNGQTWFYKIIGSDTAVGPQKEAFIQFVETVRYPDAL